MKTSFNKHKRIIIIVLIALMGLLFISLMTSCQDTSYNKPQQSILTGTESFPRKVYSGHRWDVVQISEEVFAIIPGTNANSRSEPVIFNKNEVKHINVDGWKP